MHSNIASSAVTLLTLLVQVQLSTAATCTPSLAYAVEDYIASNPGGGGGGAANPDIFLSYDIIGNAVSNSVKKRHPLDALFPEQDGPAKRTPDAKLANLAYAIRRHQRRAAKEPEVTCSAAEMCLSVQKEPFCLNLGTGEFHDGTGTTGNALTGDYVLKDGREGNLYNGPHPLPGGSEAAETTGSSTKSTGGGAKETSAGGSGAGGSAVPTETGAPVSENKGSGVSGGMERALGGSVLGGLMAVVAMFGVGLL